jgi:hypothetical protein
MYSDRLNVKENEELNKYKKIIIWGFPLHSHTHSYIHAMWVKVFQVGFNKDTYWFHDDKFPADFDYEHCLFITEGYADKNIPIIHNSVYFVHNAIHPQKYLSKNVRLIEIRFNVNEIHDINNDFHLDDGTHSLIELTPHAKYEKLYSNKDIHKSNRGDSITKMNYECIYLYWGTDLLPHEFNYADISIPKENVVNYVGSGCNSNNYREFRMVCSKNGIQWKISDPWRSPLSFEENKLLMQKSILAPDFRPTGTSHDTELFGIKNGKNHLEIGYLPCRVLKAISYGQLGITDSKYVKAILGDHVIYDSNMENLFVLAMKERTNTYQILNAMKFVQENHTYVNRAIELIKALCQ